jgi:hypothetical protein
VTTLGLLMVIVGLAVIAVAAWLARAPLTMIRHLDATEANLRRYDEWRGGRHADSEGGTTGADEMRAFMRRRLLLLAGAGIAGGILVVVGLLQR